MKTQVCLLPLCLIALAPVCGCLSGSNKADTSNYFLLEVERQGDSEPAANSIILMVQPFATSPGIDQRELVYRRSLSRYEKDYYDRFVADVGSQVAEQTRRWLSRSGCFGQVFPLGSSADATHLLEGNVTRLHGDFRNEASAQAVMEMEFFLVDIRSRKPRAVFHGAYDATARIAEAKADAIIAAYNQCLSEILTQLENNLRQTDFAAMGTTP